MQEEVQWSGLKGQVAHVHALVSVQPCCSPPGADSSVSQHLLRLPFYTHLSRHALSRDRLQPVFAALLSHFTEVSMMDAFCPSPHRRCMSTAAHAAHMHCSPFNPVPVIAMRIVPSKY